MRLERAFEKKIAKEAEKRLRMSYGYAVAAKDAKKKKQQFRFTTSGGGTGQIFASIWAPIETWLGLTKRENSSVDKGSKPRKSPKSPTVNKSNHFLSTSMMYCFSALCCHLLYSPTSIVLI
jgi:hypothetical protein